MSSTPQIFRNFLPVKNQPATIIVDELYAGTSGELFRRVDGLSPSLKSRRMELGPQDFISRMPDEILLEILSRLTIEETGRTSLLSTRWTTLWRRTPELCFRSLPKLINKVRVNEDPSDFISKVNRVLQLHEAPALDKFSVYVEARNYSSVPVSAWVFYALSRRTKKLELSFLNFTRYKGSPSSRAVFGFANSYSGSSRPSLTKHFLNHCDDFSSLKEATFCGLEVKDAVLEYLLLRCGGLERLTVLCAKSLNNLVISSSSLRYLKITYTGDSLKAAEVRSCPKLETLILDYEGQVKLVDIPMVTELHIYTLLIPSIPLNESTFSCLLSQIKILMLHCSNPQTIEKFGQVRELSKLEMLVINTSVLGADSLMMLTYLAAASPNLQKFVLQLYREPLKSRRVRREMKRMSPPLKMKCLEVVEVSGYYGSTFEDELIVSLLEDAAAAKKLVLNPRNDTPLTCMPFFQAISRPRSRRAAEEAERENARDHARLLPEFVPHHVEVVVL